MKRYFLCNSIFGKLANLHRQGEIGIRYFQNKTNLSIWIIFETILEIIKHKVTNILSLQLYFLGYSKYLNYVTCTYTCTYVYLYLFHFLFLLKTSHQCHSSNDSGVSSFYTMFRVVSLHVQVAKILRANGISTTGGTKKDRGKSLMSLQRR